MAQNRTIPYGYKIENGKTIAEPQEAEVIRRIYKEYAAGLSYKKIAEQLTASDIRYMPDKPVWNKNMVARILQNQSYLGTEKYPSIIEPDLSHSAQQMAKPYTHTEPHDIKALKPLLVCGICGEPILRRLKTGGEERWYCPSDKNHIAVSLTDELLIQSISALQKYLAENAELVMSEQKADNQIDLSVMRLQNEIDLAMNQQEPDLTAIQKSVMELAARKYALLQDKGGCDKEIAKRLTQIGADLDSSFLKEITAQIKVTHTAAEALVLKNETIIQPTRAWKGESEHE